MHRYLASVAHLATRKWLVVALLGVLFTAWMLWTAITFVPTHAKPVGLMRRAYFDASRQSWGSAEARPLATLVWYPAVAEALEKEWSVAIFQAGQNAQGAALAARPAKFPLVVLSHGTGAALWVCPGWPSPWRGRVLSWQQSITMAILLPNPVRVWRERWFGGTAPRICAC